MKRKSNPSVALGVVLGALLGAVVMTFLFYCVLCAITHTPNGSLNGFDEWDPEQWSRLESPLDALIKKDFLAEYPYADGDYHVDWYESFLGPRRSRNRSFVWLTYDDPAVYETAKQSRFDAATSIKLYPFEDPDVYGFTFYYVGENDPFPEHVSVFGFNDQTRTLVFVGFWGGGKKETPHIEAGSTDFAGFLDHYFGEWFDWEAGDRAPS